MNRTRFTRTLEALPKTVPFVPPEALERQTGRPIKARLGANESLFGVSPLAEKAMSAALLRVHCYGDPESFELRRTLATVHQVPEGNISVGSGVDDLLALTVRSFIEPGDPVVASLGTYPTFAYFVSGHGGELHRVPYRDDKNDLAGLMAKAHETSAKLLYLANPDNPSGSWHSAGDLEEFIRVLPSGTTLILDEAYADFAPPGTVPNVPPDHPRVIRMRTFSKVWGLAGARIGYATTSKEIVDAWDKIRPHFGVNIVAQAAALASLGDPEFARNVALQVEEGRRDYERIASRFGFRALPSATNFVTIDVGGVERAKALVSRLIERDVFIRMPGAPPLNRCIRVSVGPKGARDLFEAALLTATIDLP